jgi:hypothetical protein
VLTLSVRAPSAAEASRDADAIGAAYLAARRSWLDQRRAELVTGVQRELMALTAGGEPAQRTRDYLTAVGAELASADTSPGRTVRATRPKQTSSRQPVAVTSGIALGLLLGSIRVRRTHRRKR